MAFFLVMWILGMDESARNAVEGYFSNPVGYKKGYSSGSNPVSIGSGAGQGQSPTFRLIMRATEQEQLEETGARISSRIRSELARHSISMLAEVVMTEQGLRIELIEGGGGETFFALGSKELKPTARLVLDVIGEELEVLANPVVVEGHTDAATFVTGGYTNWELSADRANAARQALELAGVDPGRIQEVRGYASTRLRLPELPLDPANRRISILLPFTSPAPDADDAAGRGTSA